MSSHRFKLTLPHCTDTSTRPHSHNSSYPLRYYLIRSNSTTSPDGSYTCVLELTLQNLQHQNPSPTSCHPSFLLQHSYLHPYIKCLYRTGTNHRQLLTHAQTRIKHGCQSHSKVVHAIQTQTPKQNYTHTEHSSDLSCHIHHSPFHSQQKHTTKIYKSYRTSLSNRITRYTDKITPLANHYTLAKIPPINTYHHHLSDKQTHGHSTTVHKYTQRLGGVAKHTLTHTQTTFIDSTNIAVS